MSVPQQNLDSLAGQGEFHSKKPGAEPLTHKGVSQSLKPRSMAIFNRTNTDVNLPPTAQARSQGRQRRCPRIQRRGARARNSSQRGYLQPQPGVRSAGTSTERRHDSTDKRPGQSPRRNIRLRPQRNTVRQARAGRFQRREAQR